MIRILKRYVVARGLSPAASHLDLQGAGLALAIPDVPRDCHPHDLPTRTLDPSPHAVPAWLDKSLPSFEWPITGLQATSTQAKDT